MSSALPNQRLENTLKQTQRPCLVTGDISCSSKLQNTVVNAWEIKYKLTITWVP